MTTTYRPAYQYDEIDAAIGFLPTAMGQVRTVLPGEEPPPTTVGPIERLLRIYDTVRPLLATVAGLEILPKSWRAAMSRLIDALEALVDYGAAP